MVKRSSIFLLSSSANIVRRVDVIRYYMDLGEQIDRERETDNRTLNVVETPFFVEWASFCRIFLATMKRQTSYFSCKFILRKYDTSRVGYLLLIIYRSTF